ncbi:uncharacterized protein LOC133914489 [Phragmites australis]|uniref:uncharacterized protein LOC133914489 n=1 Tax=Phragmites australis TaxID=29695 RepID=UPI002D764CC9|nr:uncharacterized protein LOC133914489 [Phragmites australis]
MEFFPNRIHVRLRNRVTGAYLHADEDGVGVSLRRTRASLNAAWAVHRVVRLGFTYVLLHSSANGRYLALSADHVAPRGHRGRRVVQRDYDEVELSAVMWMGVRVVGGIGDYAFLRHVSYGHLRANGKFRTWHNGVTVDFFNMSNMMHWLVEAIPPRPAPPVLPVPCPTQNLGGRHGLFRRRVQPVVERSRVIRCFGANGHGNFDQLGAFQFYGRSVYNLRNEVALRVGEEIFSGITVCVRAGWYGRLTPLVIDLPESEEDMDIVVLITGSPGESFATSQRPVQHLLSASLLMMKAAEALRHPDVDAP